MSKIADGLKRLFEKHRIVVWYDEAAEFEQEFANLELTGVRCHAVANNQFGLKYEMLIVAPQTKFLLYAKHKRPEDDQNWLLDIELSNVVFHTDQEALTLQELDLAVHYRSWVNRHLPFFKSKQRVALLANNLTIKEGEEHLTKALLQTVLGCATSGLEDMLRAYLTAFVNGKAEALDRDLEQYKLTDALWSWVKAVYAYDSKVPGIYDFALEVFQKNFGPMAAKVSVNKSVEVLLSGWKDAKSFDNTYRELVKKIESDLAVEKEIKELTLDDLKGEDVFESIERHIIQSLAAQLGQAGIAHDKFEAYIKARESSYWFEKYQEFYSALRFANWLLEEINKQAQVRITDYQDGFNQYTQKWYLLEQYYRKFIQHYRSTNQNNVLHATYQQVHKVYSNTWLIKLSEAWQGVIDKSEGWYFGANSQRKFFKRAVSSNYLEKGITLFVVISDALRFECGHELQELFEKEPRFSSKLEYQVTGLPSYTQLGMAALLPHQSLAFAEGDAILVDGKNSIGAQARKKILEEGSQVRATTILAEDLMKMASRSEDARKLIQEHDLIYVYHNRIDKVGDDKTSEDKVIEAAKDEIEFLMEVARKITNMNGVHLVITADHGFVYQHETLEESDFTDAQISGDLVKDSRRFVLGRGLHHNNNVVKYTAKELEIDSDLEILIPKGINRLRKQGSGSRYVHGGATLQEVVVPLLYVSKKRTDTVSKVDIDVLKGSNRITTNIQRVKFFQQQAVGAGILPRTVKAYFCVFEGERKKVLSDLFNYTFDTESERSEDREVEYKFTISTNMRKSNEVYLMVDEQVEKSNKWNNLLKLPYTLNLAMENDFDDF
jgi:uncharacterized protein (TIGR02687 family)